MARVAVVTDSAACIPTEFVQGYDIHIVPFELVWNGQSYRDGLDITPTEVYRRLRELREENSWPTTSQPALGAFATLYAELSRHAAGIVSIHVPAELSGTLHTAELAAAQAATVPVRVIDARTAAIAQGFVVMAAAQAAAAGKNLDEVVAAAEATIPRVGLYATLESLEYLRRGGRIGEAAAVLGTRLRIYPVLYLAEGRVKVAGVARNRRHALERILDLMEERTGKRAKWAAVSHADAAADAMWLKQHVRERFAYQEFFVTEFTPVMGVHTGPGTIVLAFCAEDESARS